MPTRRIEVRLATLHPNGSFHITVVQCGLSLIARSIFGNSFLTGGLCSIAGILPKVVEEPERHDQGYRERAHQLWTPGINVWFFVFRSWHSVDCIAQLIYALCWMTNCFWFWRNGGMCMHDEAAVHYIDMIDQTTLGHRYIKEEFGQIPRIGWQIDPFGHSAVQAYLLGTEVSCCDHIHLSQVCIFERCYFYICPICMIGWTFAFQW